MTDGLVDQFVGLRPQLSALGARLESSLRGWLAEAGIPTHFVTWRVKDAASLATKLARPEKTYRHLWDVTDLVGVRIATSFEDHLDAVSRLIERKLRVDFAHSAQQAKPAGYRSLHYICALDDAPHPDFRAEIQVRTALQHAWAEVEHDLGYKVNDAVPEAIRHRFARVAGLLEIADAEFVSLRRDLAASREAARVALERRAVVPIDLLSLDALVKEPVIEALDAAIAGALSLDRAQEPFFADYLVKVLRHAGLTTTSDVLAAVEAYGAQVPAALGPYFSFARNSLGFDLTVIDRVQRGYGLLFVALLSVVRADELSINKAGRLTRLFEKTEFPGDERTAQRVAGELLATLG